MARKQVGLIDEGLLTEVDRRAAQLGQTRRVFVERALRERLDRMPEDAIEDASQTTPPEEG